jgi:uncharacterized membrane protein YqjE
VVDRIVVRWEFDSSSEGFGRTSRLRRLLMMRKIALTLAFLAIASVLVMILVVMFTAQNS